MAGSTGDGIPAEFLAGRESWDPNRECAAAPGPIARCGHGSAVELDETPDERQADAQPALGAVQRAFPLHEHVEHRGQQLRRDPDPGVLDREHRLVALGR